MNNEYNQRINYNNRSMSAPYANAKKSVSGNGTRRPSQGTRAQGAARTGQGGQVYGRQPRALSSKPPVKAPGRQHSNMTGAANRQASSRPAHSRRQQKRIKKKPNVVLFLFIVVCAFALTIVIKQCITKNASDNIMELFETKAAVADNANGAMLEADDKSPAKATYAAYSKNTGKLNIDSKYGILINLKDNTVVADKDGEQRIYPASMTKLMTLIVAYENIKNLDDTFTFDFKIVNDAYLAGASVAGFTTNETVPIKDLLYGTILPSGADATAALAMYIAGSEEDFAILMNKKVEEMGLKNTHFVTSSGLHDENHYSTCHDMAMILKYAISNPYLRNILSTYKYITTPTPEHPNGIELYSTMYKKMAGDEAEGVYIQGGKTGYTKEGKHCLASFAAVCSEDESQYTEPEYILVTAYGESEYKPIYDAINSYKTFLNK